MMESLRINRSKTIFQYGVLYFCSDALASDPTGGRVSIIVMQNSLNIHSTGIHALGIFFSIKFCMQRGQDEISLTISKFGLFNWVAWSMCAHE